MKTFSVAAAIFALVASVIATPVDPDLPKRQTIQVPCGPPGYYVYCNPGGRVICDGKTTWC
ncbi:hypothetical protein Slin15195_G074270 [Septoria linicola]|uniref:Uncharacterized protein n=1 Tax=Septoria linicola TaxID=215465 RepID=A0A9Q9EM57_9PEZI|nr:hypothetical protein Slin14017_G035390 [Septoria linicola]USW54108.1 hypothetical protein Slin15195_G074270 [Septoria linicola]